MQKFSVQFFEASASQRLTAQLQNLRFSAFGSSHRFRCPIAFPGQPIGALLMSSSATLAATSVHDYGSDEYVTIVSGISPDGKYAITAHGEGDNGYDHFHIYLTDAVSGKKIGPLEEIVDALDTGADAFCAKWSNDSKTVTIIYRVDQLNRYLPLRAVSYRMSERRAHRLKGPFKVRGSELFAYYQDSQHETKPSPKVFGTPLK